MLAACRQRLSPAFVTALQGSPVTASGLRAEVGAIACDAARLGALAPARTFGSAAGRVPRATRGDPRALLAPFRRHLRVSAPAAAWKRTPEGYVRVPRDAEDRRPKTARRNRGGARAAGRGGTSEEGPSSMNAATGGGVSAPPYGDDAKTKTKPIHTKGVGSRAFIQVLALGTDVSDTSPSVLLFTDSQRIVFNVGEGFQRFAVEHGINIRRLNRVCLTSVSARTTGGLTGMLLTMADGVTEHHEDEPELKIHGPPRTERLMGAVDTLVGGRGVRTVVHTFPVADAGGGAPTVRDDCVTLTPIVVRPRRPAGNQSAKSSGAAGGPLRVPPAFKTADTRDSASRAKRARTDEPVNRKNTSVVFSAYAADSADAESVCYHGQLAAMPGKFDASKADALGVPRGAVRGALVRGEDVVLPDGRTIRSEDVVARRRAGFRFAVVDVPTLAHLEALADPTSEAGRRFGEVFCGGGAAGEDEIEGGRLAVVVHLAPAAVATSAAYERWMETCGAFHVVGDGLNKFDRPRHLMVHSEATGGACVFRSAAAVNARLHAVDSNVFPEPRNADLAVADAQARALADAAAREADGFSKNHVLTHPGCNLSRFTLVPLDAAGLDARAVPRALVARSVREDLDVTAAVARSRGPSARSDAYLSEEVPSALRALSPGDVELVFLGTGSSMPAKYRNVSGLFLDQKTRGGVILDCGEGSFGQLCRLYGAETARSKVRDLRCAWISHIHADHHVGLPTILVERRRAMLADGVGEDAVEPLLVVGPAPLRRFLNAFSQVEPLSFDFVDCRETTSEKWDRLETLEKLETLEETINDGRLNDEVDSTSLKIVDPRVSAAARSLGLRRLVSVPVAHCAQSFALALEAAPPAGSAADAGWKAVYSGDTRPCAALVAAARDATVLIHEATFEDDLLEDAVKKRHSTTSEAIQTGVDAGCYRTILTHFSQRYPKAPKFDGHIGNGTSGEVREDANQEDANQDDDSDARSRKNVSDRVGVAFDLMRVDFTALPRVPSLMPAVRALFPDPVEDAAPAEEAAAE